MAMGFSGLLAGPVHAATDERETTLNIGAINVEDSALSEPTEAAEQVGYTVKRTGSATGLRLSPRQTPQTVTTLTREQMTDRQITNIEEALAATPGITASKLEVGVRTNYRARGYAVSNWKIDGVQFPGATGFGGGGNAMNLDLYERIDIVRGANGLLGGTGDPSATVDLRRKRAGRTFGGSAYATYGSWDKRRLGADLNLPLSEDGRLRSRFVVTQEDARSFRDQESSRSRGALATFEFDLSDATTLGAGYAYEYNKVIGSGWGANIPVWFADGSKAKVSRSTNLAPSWSHSAAETQTAFASLEHRFDNDWELNARLTHGVTEARNKLAVAKVNQVRRGLYGGYWQQDGSGAVLNALGDASDTTQQGAQIDLSGPFQLLGRTHEAMFGYSDNRTVAWAPEYNCVMSDGLGTEIASAGCMYRLNGLPISDWHNGVDDNFYMSMTRSGRHSKTTTRLQGLYAATRLSITDPLSVIVGLRTSDYRVTSRTVAAVHSSQQENGVVTPYAGIVYDLNDNYSVYASYTDVFTPQTQLTTSGNRVEPIVGKSYEGGIKGEWFDGSLNAQVAYFRTQQDNKAVLDVGNVTPTGTDAYKAGTGVETDGIDIEVAGALTPDWNVYGGYTYLHFRRVDSDGRSDPSHLFKLSSTYRLPGELNRLTLGAGVNAQSNIRALSSPAGIPTNGQSTGSTAVNWSGYAIWNAMAKYDVTDATSVSLNANNLLDKRYFTNYGFYAGAVYGEPRNLSVSLRTAF
ncbi:TonB-dependent siderophore receptor [Pseudomonas sp. ABC1]|uniref:TonB-dependent siderophore receptor n=1 Tax=Pseudomonas sp. ABC1 TaxID=2748080 RepID=UPI0015C3BD11|nr:TonB-dependent receptor [Pseudomonas sp. ABC1]QLF93708.1 TonB-dependent siderophore receptor [Pseudomonas sp. ABC1]